MAKREYLNDPRTRVFTPAAKLETEGNRIFGVVDELLKAGQLHEAFVERLADAFQLINDAHFFRQGNGRTQRLFLAHMAREAGHPFAFLGIAKERMVAASIAADKDDPQPLRRILAELYDPFRAAALKAATDGLDAIDKTTFDWNERYIATTEPGQEYSGVLVKPVDENHFLMRTSFNLYIGNWADLPDAGKSLKVGDRVAHFRANAIVRPARVVGVQSVSPAKAGQTYVGIIASAEPGQDVLQNVEGQLITHGRHQLFGRTAY